MNTRDTTLLPTELQEQLDRYAQLIAVHGLNVQPGQLVNVSSEVYHRGFLELLVGHLYQRGAGFVNVELSDPMLQRTRILKSAPGYLSRLPDFYSAKFAELVDSGGANLKVLGPEHPEYLADLAPQLVNEVRKASYHAAKRFYTEGIEKSKVHWCVVAAATPRWAQRIFPALDPREGEQKLWREILKICRVDRADFLSAWVDHNARLVRRAASLTALGIRSLRFTGPGTDLTVGLSERAIFRGGADQTPSGYAFEPNIPTEECFTTPDFRLTNGTVAATRPFLVNGQLVSGLSMSFENGELRAFSCREGHGAFEAYIGSDAGAKRLGEVALVGIDSPVYQSGLVFEEILFDENAACHIAIGSAYRACVSGGPEMSDEDAAAIGCNASSVHTDIMISSAEVDVKATLQSGEECLLLHRGEWVGEFAP
jgi:aminopeptidase